MDRAASTRLKKLLLAAALLAGLYPAGANLFLNTPLGPWAVNRRPQRVRVTWDRAWTILPGEVRVRGLRIEGHTGRVDWWVTAERGRGWIDLPGLLVRRFRVHGFTAEGVRSSTLRHEVESPGRRDFAPPRRAPWRIEMRDVALAGVREIGWNGFRLEGDGTARGAFSLVVGGDFALDPSTLSMPRAKLSAGADPVARDLDVVAAASIAPYTPRRHPGVVGFEYVSGTLRARGKAAVPDLSAASRQGAAPAAGDLDVDLRLSHGRLEPGSRASLRAGPLLTALLDLEPGAAGSQLVFRADAQGFSAGRRTVVAAEALHLEAATLETRLSRLLAQARTLRHSGNLPDGPLRATWSAAGLHATSSGSQVSWRLTADHGAGQIDLTALFHRQILLSAVRADGIAAAIERAPAPQLPAGPGAWTVRLVDVRLAAIRDIAYGDLRLDSPDLAAAGDLAVDSDGTFALDRLELQTSAGRLRRGEETLVHGLALRGSARLGPYAPRADSGSTGKSAWLEFLSGTVAASGHLAALPFLAGAGRNQPGSFTCDLRIDRGRLAPGTRIEVSAGRALQVAAAVAAEAFRPPRLLITAQAKGLVFGGGGDYPPLLRAGTVVLRTATPELRLHRLLATAGDLQAGRPAAGEPVAADVEIQGLQATGVGERVIWQLAADRGSGRLDLPALLERRIVLSGALLSGAVAQIDPATGPPPVVPPAERWAVEIQGARIDDLRSLALQTDRLVGSGRLEGDLSFDRSRLLTVSRAFLEMTGRVESGGAPVARRVSVRTTLRIAPAVPGQLHGGALLRLVSGDAAVQGDVSSLGFLRRYLRRVPWLQVEGAGQLDADVRLAAGELLPGSRVAVRGGKVRAAFLDSIATGEATVTGAVEAGPKAALRVDFSAFAVAPDTSGADGEPPASYMTGAGLRLGITSTDLDLATPVSDLKATIDLPAGQVPDLTVYNAYLPPGTGVSILSGAGRLRLHFSLDATAQSGDGEILLASDRVRVRFQDVELDGNLLLRGQLSSKDLRARSFQIAGTRLDLDRVTYRELGAEPGEASPDWWAHLQMTDGAMAWGRPLALSSHVILEMKSSGFLLSVFARRKNFLHWFQRLLSIEGVRAEGMVRCGDGAIEIAPLRVTGGRFDLRSRLRFTRDTKQGDLFIRWGKLATGIELRDGKRTFKLRHPEAWFESGREPD